MKKNNLTRIIHCSVCSKAVEAENPSNESKTLKSWNIVCLKCWGEILRRITKLENKVFRIPKKRGRPEIKY